MRNVTYNFQTTYRVPEVFEYTRVVKKNANFNSMYSNDKKV